METLPFYVYLVFGITVLLGVWLFLKAANYARLFLIVIGAWLIIQSTLGILGFYNDVNSMTSRFPLLVVPPMIFLISRFFTTGGRALIDSINIKTLSLFHIIRIPVEITLFWLFVNKSIPEAMTFEGRNFDILSGLTAPFIYYFGFVKNVLGKKVIIAWNLICMGLLLNVVTNAFLSLPGRFESFGFEQPNLAVGFFPFLLLPTVLVPLVLFSHWVSIRQLLLKDL